MKKLQEFSSGKIVRCRLEKLSEIVNIQCVTEVIKYNVITLVCIETVDFSSGQNAEKVADDMKLENSLTVKHLLQNLF